MLLRTSFITTLSLFFLVGSLFCAVGTAHALADFMSSDGSLEFKNFILSDTDESVYEFVPIDHGFTIIMLDGALPNLDLNLVYDVYSLGAPITSATLSFDAVAGGGVANVIEVYSTNLNLLVLETAVFSQTTDSGTFAPVQHLTADKDIGISLVGDPQIFSVTQTYGNPVPEPSAALLFGIGVGTVGLAIRRRQS